MMMFRKAAAGFAAAAVCFAGAWGARTDLIAYVPEDSELTIRADGLGLWRIPQIRRLIEAISSTQQSDKVLLPYLDHRCEIIFSVTSPNHLLVLLRPTEKTPRQFFEEIKEALEEAPELTTDDVLIGTVPGIILNEASHPMRLLLLADRLELYAGPEPYTREVSLARPDSPHRKLMSEIDAPLSAVLRINKDIEQNLPVVLSAIEYAVFRLDIAGPEPILHAAVQYPDRDQATMAQGLLDAALREFKKTASGAQLMFFEHITYQQDEARLNLKFLLSDALVDQLDEEWAVAPSVRQLSKFIPAFPLYVSEHKKMPDALNDLYQGNFMTRAGDFLVAHDTKGFPAADGAPVLEENTSFLYWGQGMDPRRSDANLIPVMTLRPDLARRNFYPVLFLDGHIEVQRLKGKSSADLYRELLTLKGVQDPELFTDNIAKSE